MAVASANHVALGTFRMAQHECVRADCLGGGPTGWEIYLSSSAVDLDKLTAEVLDLLVLLWDVPCCLVAGGESMFVTWTANILTGT